MKTVILTLLLPLGIIAQEQRLTDTIKTKAVAYGFRAINGKGSGNRPAHFDPSGNLIVGSGSGTQDLSSVLGVGNSSTLSIALTGNKTTTRAQSWGSMGIQPFDKNNVMMIDNAVYNSGFKYVENGYASGFYLTAGETRIVGAATGTAGTAMTLYTHVKVDEQGLVTNYGGHSWASSSGTNRDVFLFNPNSGTDNLSYLTLQPKGATNASTQFHMMPKGTGYGSTFKSGLSLWNTDFIADPTNYEVLQLNAAGASGFVFNSASGGTGTTRSMHLQTNNFDRILISGSGAIQTPGYINGYLKFDGSGNWSVDAGTGSSGTDFYSANGTLTSSRSVSGAGTYALNLGASGSTLSALNVWAPQLNIYGGAIKYHSLSASNADYSFTGNSNFLELPTGLSANRTLTLPAATLNGQLVTVIVPFTTNTFHWNLAAAVTDIKTSTTFTQLEWGYTYEFFVTSAVTWQLIKKY